MLLEDEDLQALLELNLMAPFRLTRAAVRGMLLGGEPLDGPRHLFWNFVSSDPERIEAAKRDWATAAGTGGSERFPNVPGDADERIPLP